MLNWYVQPSVSQMSQNFIRKTLAELFLIVNSGVNNLTDDIIFVILAVHYSFNRIVRKICL